MKVPLPTRSPSAWRATGARRKLLTRNRAINTAIWQAQSREKLDAAKAKVSISDAWHALDLPGEPRRSCRSPFREDRHPSFSISADGRLWHDFATDEGGDVVDFIRLGTGCSDREAITRVLELAGGGFTAPVTVAPRPVAAARPLTDNLAGVDLHPPTLGEVIALAELRNWPTFASLELARLRGLLCMADVPWRGETHRAWIFTDESRRSAQARRLDGMEWPGEHYVFKSNSLRTDPNFPPGLADVISCDRRAVLICEGEPDSLAALLLAWAGGVGESTGVLCLTGASKPLPLAVLEKLRGRRCRVFRQADPAGHKAALAWAESIHAAGVAVDLANLDGRTRADGQPAKDLADLCRRPAGLENLELLSAELLGDLVS